MWRKSNSALLDYENIRKLATVSYSNCKFSENYRYTHRLSYICVCAVSLEKAECNNDVGFQHGKSGKNIFFYVQSLVCVMYIQRACVGYRNLFISSFYLFFSFYFFFSVVCFLKKNLYIRDGVYAFYTVRRFCIYRKFCRYFPLDSCGAFHHSFFSLCRSFQFTSFVCRSFFFLSFFCARCCSLCSRRFFVIFAQMLKVFQCFCCALRSFLLYSST